MAESAPSPLETRIEPVPGYTPRGLATIAPEAMPVSINRNLVEDASLGAFRGQDIVEVVIGDDDRKAVPDATQSPWRHICALRIRTRTNKDYVGTGWLIGPRTIMTAGHCVFMHDHGGWAKSISVIPALEGHSRPYGLYKSTRFSAVDGWTVNRDSDFDYGVIFLDEPVGSQAGWFAFAAASVGNPDGIFANSYHIKVAVRDGRAFWLSSGNWQSSNQPEIDPLGADASIPNILRTYNREWHVIVEHPGLARLFEKYIEWDYEQARSLETAREAFTLEMPDLFVPETIALEAEEAAFIPRYFAPARLHFTPNKPLRLQPPLHAGGAQRIRLR